MTIHLKDVDGMADSVDPDQTASLRSGFALLARIFIVILKVILIHHHNFSSCSFHACIQKGNERAFTI